MSLGRLTDGSKPLTQMAWDVVTNVRRACGEQDDLTRAASTLHLVLCRLQDEMNDAGGPLHRREHPWRQDIEVMIDGIGICLRVAQQTLENHVALWDENVNAYALRRRFDDGGTADLEGVRTNIKFHTSLIKIYLNLAKAGPLGRVEQEMYDAGNSRMQIPFQVKVFAAQVMSQRGHENTVLTLRSRHYEVLWDDFRRFLLDRGFQGPFIHQHKAQILRYVEELRSRGAFDNAPFPETQELTRRNDSDEVGPSYRPFGSPSNQRHGIPGGFSNTDLTPVYDDNGRLILGVAFGDDFYRMHEDRMLNNIRNNMMRDDVQTPKTPTPAKAPEALPKTSKTKRVPNYDVNLIRFDRSQMGPSCKYSAPFSHSFQVTYRY